MPTMAPTLVSDSIINCSVNPNARIVVAPFTDSVKWEKIGDLLMDDNRLSCLLDLT